MSLHVMVQRNFRRAIGTRFFPKIGTMPSRVKYPTVCVQTAWLPRLPVESHQYAHFIIRLAFHIEGS